MSATVYKITPVPKPRMTKSDRWASRPVVQKYWAFKKECRLQGVTLPEGSLITFVMPMPASWSGKKRQEHLAQAHRQTPDIDNLVKGLLDAIFDDDSGVAEIHARKVWGEAGQIIITPVWRASSCPEGYEHQHGIRDSLHGLFPKSRSPKTGGG